MDHKRQIGRRAFLKSTAAAVSAFGMGGCAKQMVFTERIADVNRKSRRPNIILVLVDDISAFDIGCYGSPFKTPNIDRMAAEGVRFETCWATPMCTPSRAELLTGKYGFRTRVYHNAMRPSGSEPGGHWGDSYTLIPELLKRYGYVTMLAGKWQMDGSYPTVVFDYGFDEYCRHHEWIKNLPEGAQFDGYVAGEKHMFPGRTSGYWHPCVTVNGQLMKTTRDDYGPDIYTDYILDFMTRHQDRPFFVYYPMMLAHHQTNHIGDQKMTSVPVPIRDANGKWTGGVSPTELKYNVEYVDYLMGRIRRHIEKLGLADETIIIFTADNASLPYGKCTPTESGCREPLICFAPGIIQKGVVSEELVDFTDIYPTIAEFAQAKMPADDEFDGLSFAGILRGDKNAKTRDWIFSYYADKRMLRTKNWYRDGNGRFYDCRSGRTGKYTKEYHREVTDSTEPEVIEAKQRFEGILENLPEPPADDPLRDRFHQQWEIKFQENLKRYEKNYGSKKTQEK